MSVKLGHGLRAVLLRHVPGTEDGGGPYAERACRDVDPELFFPVGKGALADRQYERAREVCDRCPVWVTCLQEALERGDEFGMFGGYTHEERKDFGVKKETRPCLVCSQEFEPPRRTQSTCTPCQMRGRTGGMSQLEAFLRKFGDELAQACREGVSDKAFGERHNISHHLVGRARVVLGIPPVSKGGGARQPARSRVGAGV